MVNGEKVVLCTKAHYLGILLNTEDKYDAVEDGILNFNISFNRFLSNFNTCCASVKNKLFQQYCCSYYGSQLWPLSNNKFDKV